MTKPKRDPSDKGESGVARTLPSRAREASSDLTDAPTLGDAEVSAANAAYQVRFIRYDKLAPYARNHQIHDEAQVAAIAASIEEFGFVGAVIADKTGILAGHGRTLAAERLYKAGKRIKAPNGARIPNQTVPWIDVTGMSDAQRRAYIIADNQLTRRAGVNQEFLRLEIGDLAALDFNLDLLGFDAKALDAIMSPPSEDDAEPEVDGDPALDEPEAPTVICCPKCQHQFSILAERKDEAKPKRRKRAA